MEPKRNLLLNLVGLLTHREANELIESIEETRKRMRKSMNIIARKFQ